MLILTDTAAEVVKSITSTPQAPDSAGLRIASAAPDSADPAAMQVTAATGPSENDQVIESDGARVYLEPLAAEYLDDKVLDAQVDGQGKAHFFLGAQGSGETV